MEASVTGLFRVLIILIAAYYIFKIVVRFVLPFLVRRFLNNAQKNFYKANPHLDPDPKPTGKEGEVKVKTNSTSKVESKTNDFGEYVDYEEIKD